MARAHSLSLILWLLSGIPLAVGQNRHTQVVLDRDSFPPSSYALMSRTAKQVARVIDQLIPVQPNRLPTEYITCFVAKEGWTERPITLFGPVRPGEPQSSLPGHIRIAVTNNVLPGAYQRLAFQLAHELAHVKMDPRVDNKIVETFAVAVSLEVISRMGYSSFVETNQHFYAEPLPAEIKASIARHDYGSISIYLRYKRHDHELQPSDYSLQLLGAILIRADRQFSWQKLSGVALNSTCHVDLQPVQVKWCPMTNLRDAMLRTLLRRLGQDDTRKLIVRVSSERSRDRKLFEFEENNRWVALRYIGRQEIVPRGFTVAE